jgi:hypothetical protein
MSPSPFDAKAIRAGEADQETVSPAVPDILRPQSAGFAAVPELGGKSMAGRGVRQIASQAVERSSSFVW